MRSFLDFFTSDMKNVNKCFMLCGKNLKERQILNLILTFKEQLHFIHREQAGIKLDLERKNLKTALLVHKSRLCS
jgi:hypothetical protein